MTTIDTLLKNTELALIITSKISLITAIIGAYIGACVGCNETHMQLQNRGNVLDQMYVHIFGTYNTNSGVLKGWTMGAIYGFFTPITLPVAIFNRVRNTPLTT